MAESRPVRFGIVGCGSASIPLCDAITASSLAELAVVYDVNVQMAEDISQRFRVRNAKTFEEFLADPAIDAAYIAVPHYLLAPFTQQVLEAGKHALTEKPLALSLEEIDRLIALATRNDLRLGVFYEMRYVPAYAMARQLVRAGAIGRIIGAHVQTLIDKPLSYWQYGYISRSNNPWRGLKAQAGGGVVLMNTSHLLDALTYVTGLVVTQVSAEVDTLAADVEVEDIATATFRLNNGAIGSLMAGAHIIGADRDECFDLYGTKGQIRLPDPYGPDPLRFYLQETWRDFGADLWHSFPAVPLPVHQMAMEDFVQAVQSGAPAPIDAAAARQVLSVVLSIYRSATERRTISIL